MSLTVPTRDAVGGGGRIGVAPSSRSGRKVSSLIKESALLRADARITRCPSCDTRVLGREFCDFCTERMGCDDCGHPVRCQPGYCPARPDEYPYEFPEDE